MLTVRHTRDDMNDKNYFYCFDRYANKYRRISEKEFERILDGERATYSITYAANLKRTDYTIVYSNTLT